MTGERTRLLYGRDPLLRSLMPQLTGLAYGERARVRWEPRTAPPVVMVAGQHGMGRSAVLEDLATQYAGRLPFAYVQAVPPDRRPSVPQPDEAPGTAATFVELLQELVCGLAPGLPSRYPLRRASARHPFRTLLPGLIAVSGWKPGDADERDETCLRIARMLTACGLGGGQDVKRLGRTWAEGVEPAEQAAGRSGGEGQGGAAFEELTRHLVEEFAEVCPLGPAQEWYAEQYGETSAGGAGAPSPLVRLGLRLHQGGDPGRASERTLVAALLRDIAAAYGPLQRANRDRWPLILLDDAHHPPARRFIDLLLEQRARGEQPHDDHLVLAATHLGGMPEEAPDAVRCELPLLADALKKPEPRPGRSPSAGMLVVPLTPLSRDEILSLLDRADTELHPYLASAVYALTDGHPAASTMLCDAVLAAAWRQEKVTPDSLLELTDGDGRPVTSVILEQLLPQQRQRQRLVQLCLARDRTAAEALAGHLGMQGPEQSPVSAAEDYLEAHRWQRYTTPDGPLVAHPMLQRLLTAEARRTMSKEGATLWGDVHDFLCDHHVRSGDEGGKFNRGRAHWHSMAAGDVDKAVGVLRDLFASWNPGDAGQWLKLLAHLGTAPVPPSGAAVDPRPRIALGEDDSAGKDPGLSDEAEWSINRLLHAVWCLSEPHTEPDPDLCAVLREEFGCLSRLHQTWRTELRHVARGWPSDAERKRPFAVPGDNSE